MTTVQIVGIAVAVAVVLLLVVALAVTRGRGRQAGGSATPTESSFLDSAPRDTLARLGTAEHAMEDVTLDPVADREGPLQAALEWPAESETLEVPAIPPTPAAEAARTVAPEDRGRGREAKSPQPGGRDGSPAAAAGVAPGSGGRVLPLSDIIVTTSSKTVDLDDPEVRRMLTELVTLEIDQAAELRGQGQIIDAVLQLTEAEKISQALGMAESAGHIREMMEELGES
ncbi:MAG: hypothetical protein WC709_04080 [Thermoleophilia bacterium]